MSDFISVALKAHNELRAKHGSPPLKHAQDLSDYAQKWAEHIAATGTFAHSNCSLDGKRVGENICYKWSSAGADYTGIEASEHWYSEFSKHDFNVEKNDPETGHFTQVVWKSTKEMGIGKAKTSDGKCYVVASYRPPANCAGQYMANVAPLV